MSDQSPLNDFDFEDCQLGEERMIDLFQRLIDDGTAWRLNSISELLAHELIEAGLCTLGNTNHRDCFGNYVPSRHEIEDQLSD